MGTEIKEDHHTLKVVAGMGLLALIALLIVWLVKKG